MKYIFIVGAPGSKWSSVAKNIYFSSNIDQSDYDENRIYGHHAGVMHIGAYFDPGMEFGDFFDRLDQYSKLACETEFDRPFSGQGTRIIKSHVFAHHIDFLRKNWPECPIVLVHRPNDACLGWWVRSGGFNISYPDYTKYYKDLDFMAAEITRQNSAMRPYWDLGSFVYNNHELCDCVKITHPPAEYQQTYVDHKVRVKVY